MKFEYRAIYFIFDWFKVELFILFYFQVWLYFEVSKILIENLKCYRVLGFWLQVLRAWISCLSENSSLRIVIRVVWLCIISLPVELIRILSNNYLVVCYKQLIFHIILNHIIAHHFPCIKSPHFKVPQIGKIKREKY